MDLLLIVAGLALLGLAALRFGQDSRDLEGAAPWHSWRESALRSRAGVASPAEPLGIDLEAAYRLESLRVTAARERLLRPARPSTRPRAALGAHRAAVAWLGALLVRAGQRLQSYGRTAAPGW